MHSCPECGQACDCDGEDTWFEDPETSMNCEHVCEVFDDDLMPDMDELDEEGDEDDQP